VSLYELLNQCKTAAGSATLRNWLLRPLRDVTVIQRRQETMQALVSQPQVLEGLRESRKAGLKAFPDISRLGKPSKVTLMSCRCCTQTRNAVQGHYLQSYMWCNDFPFVVILPGTKLLRNREAVRLQDLLTLYRAVLRLEPLAEYLTTAEAAPVEDDVSGGKQR
jgi:hypothetical protein